MAMKVFCSIWLVVITIEVFSIGVSAQQPSTAEELRAMKEDIEALKEGQRALRREIQEIKKLHQTTTNAPVRKALESVDLMISVEGEPSVGDPNARLVMIEFSEYQCPSCARYAVNTFPHILREFVNTGRVRYVFRDYPNKAHKDSFNAAEAAHCAGEQGGYWLMHDRLFANQAALSLPDLSRHALEIGLDATAFRICLESGIYGSAVQKDLRDGVALGVRATPTFYLGFAEAGSSKIRVVNKVTGAKSFKWWQDTINNLLDRQQN